MNKIFILVILSSIIGYNAVAQQMGVSLFAGPTVNIVKYNDFNTFAESYNDVNGYDLKLSKVGTGFSTGGDLFYDFFYFGFYYNKLNISSNSVRINDFSNRKFDIGLTSYNSNIGFNFGNGPISISPYVVLGINDVDLDAYVEYFRKYKTYGNYKLDGTYSGRNILVGFGAKVNLFYKIFFASLSLTKTYSVMPTAAIHDFGKKGDPVLGGGYTEIATDWDTFTSVNSWDYSGKYISSSNKQFIIQLSLGIFIGDSNN